MKIYSKNVKRWMRKTSREFATFSSRKYEKPYWNTALIIWENDKKSTSWPMVSKRMREWPWVPTVGNKLFREVLTNKSQAVLFHMVQSKYFINISV